MSRTSRILFAFLASLATVGLISSSFDALAQDKDKKKVEKDGKKDDKKDGKKDDKKDDKKEIKKEEKKEPFKLDPAQVEFKHVEKDKTYWVYAVAFAADGKSVAASYRDYSVKIWDLAVKKDILTIKGKASPDTRGLGDFKSLVYLKDQVAIGTGHWDIKKKERQGEVKFFDAAAAKAGKPLRGHSQDVVELAVSRDGKFLASASEDKTVMIWDLAQGKDVQTIKGHTDTVTSVSFSPDGKQIVTTSLDKTVRVWDIAGAKEIASFKVERTVEVKDPKSKDPKKPKTIQQKETGREFTHAVFTSDGLKVVAGNLDGVVLIYDVNTKKELKELKAHDGVLALAISPDGSTFATGGYDGTIKLWSTGDGKQLKAIKAHADVAKGEAVTVTSLSFSPSGQSLVSGGIDGVVRVWSVK